jgi:adenine-specific DNA-methyltransferase
MSRLTDLISEARARDAQLGADLEREVKALSSRLPFGLNFERHRPEAVELPLRPIRKGDKVRILPERGTTMKGDQRLWQVTRITVVGKRKLADLRLLNAATAEARSVSAEDLVVVAEFKDTIYPGLVSTGKVEHGGDKPYHTVINGENYHALKALTWSHRGQMDAIYLDPPYNSRDKDWKYNNDYVDSDDQYKHSKWLAMMERRLKVARELLRPSRSVLVVTIDENEVHRLGLLLEQLFPEADIQMVTSVISAKGAVRPGRFSRVEEHLFVATFGSVQITPWFRNMLDPSAADIGEQSNLEWLGLRRREPSSTRGARPNQFYPIFVEATTGRIQSVGDPVADDVARDTVRVPAGAVALWPLKPDGTEMLWGLTPEVLRRNCTSGFVRVNRWNPDKQMGTVQYLPGGTIDLIRDGTIKITGRAQDGSVQGVLATDEESQPPKRVWNVQSHNAEIGGTNMLSSLIPGRRFPYPKSLYAVEDLLRFFISDLPNAVVLDFFAGSGTTLHAVMRLNRQDGGQRQCISITNNEVTADEQAQLRKQGLRPGDSDWEKWGICDYITKPRVEAAITGYTPEGKPVKGNYRYTDEFPMLNGFRENAEFFTLTYETPIAVRHNVAFAHIAPLLWLRAGSRGPRIDRLPPVGWEVVDTYGLLTDLDQARAFLSAIRKAKAMRVAYIVTDDQRRFQALARRLPDFVEPVRLYEAYLTNFSFANGSEE